MQGVQVQSLVGELRSHTLRSAAKKKKKRQAEDMGGKDHRVLLRLRTSLPFRERASPGCPLLGASDFSRPSLSEEEIGVFFLSGLSQEQCENP